MGFLGRFWTKIQSDNCFETASTPGLLLEGWHCCSSNFVYNFSKTPWFPLMWMVRFVTFVHKYLFRVTGATEDLLTRTSCISCLICCMNFPHPLCMNPQT